MKNSTKIKILKSIYTICLIINIKSTLSWDWKRKHFWFLTSSLFLFTSKETSDQSLMILCAHTTSSSWLKFITCKNLAIKSALDRK